MMASRKVKAPKVKPYQRGERARKPQETAQKRVIDVSGMSQVGTWEATSFVSLPREPWDGEPAE